MRKLFQLTTLVCMLLTLSNNVYAGATDTWQGKGRIAFSSDGNFHDHDDIQATKMSMMIIAKEGLQDKLVVYTYADHIWGSDDQLEKMHTVALGSKERFGFHDANFIAAVENPTDAYNAMAGAIAASTADDPLFVVGAGPMHVIGEGLRIANASNPTSLNYVTVISHSDWNNNHGQSHKDPETTDHDGWTWTMMKNSFGSKVNFKKISDQNGTGEGTGNVYTSNDKFKASTMADWSFLNTHQDPNVNWVYQNHTGLGSNSAADYSDAGMAYFLVTGDEMGNPTKLKAFIGTDIIPVTPADPLKVAKVNLNSSFYHIKAINGTYQLSATVLPETATNKNVSWSTSDASVAEVSDAGLVTGKSLGMATISVTTEDGSKKASISIQVGEVDGATFFAGDNYICFESDATNSPLGNWKVRRKGDDKYIISSPTEAVNDTYIEYMGGVPSGLGVSATDILEYKFIPKTSGEYQLTGRMAQNRNDGSGGLYAWDQCNDIFIKVSDNVEQASSGLTKAAATSFNKFYGRGFEAWGCFVQAEVSHTKYKATYKFTAGVEYTLSIAGRSQQCCIDYFLFAKMPHSITIAEKVDLKASAPAMVPGDCADCNPGEPDLGSCDVINAVDFPKFTGMGEGFSDASIDNTRGCLQMATRLAWGAAETTYEGSATSVHVVLNTMQETDGESSYRVFIGDNKIGEVTNDKIFGTEIVDYTIQKHQLTTNKVAISKGDVIRVEFNSATNGEVPEGTTTATSRGRWKSIELCGEAAEESEPVDSLESLFTDKSDWEVIYVDSESNVEGGVGRLGADAIDGDISTFWHTEWKDAQPTLPHEIQIDMKESITIREMYYISRQDQWGPNGTVGKYEIYISDDKDNWGTADVTGEFDFPVLASDKSNLDAFKERKHIPFTKEATGRYLKFVALSETQDLSDKPFTAIAELDVIEKGAMAAAMDEISTSPILVYPNPASTHFFIKGADEIQQVDLFTLSGQRVISSRLDAQGSIDVSHLNNGMYILKIDAGTNQVFQQVMIAK